jgi:hypothetical protein
MRNFAIGLLLFLVLVGAGFFLLVDRPGPDPKYLEPIETLRAELRNPDYRWNGPVSSEDRIPVLHAARALAYRGDSSAEVLFDAIDDPNIEVISVTDALSELGIPVGQFANEIENRNSAGLRMWWAENRLSTVAYRNKHRFQIGLPSTELQ